MRKLVLSALLLSGLLFTSTGTVYAQNNSDLPYVKGLGYEVEVLENDENEITFYNYDSGWKNFLGGRWRHGVDSSQVWSYFDHSYKIHKTTVRGLHGKYSYSGWVGAGRRAAASWEKAFAGNRAWADVK